MSETLEQIALRVAKETGCVDLAEPNLFALAHRLVEALGAQEPVAWMLHGRPYLFQQREDAGFGEYYTEQQPLYAAPQLPQREGWQWVPKEPTERQWEEGKIMLSTMLECGTALDIGIVYKAMLAAAPKLEEG